ncbi:MAG: SGNH/GDSL hydrolase family protein [Gammaproteobacteria bacterium]
MDDPTAAQPDDTPPPSHRVNTRPWLFAGLAIGIGMLIGLTLLEIAVRIAAPRSLAPSVTVPHPDYNHTLAPSIHVQLTATPERFPIDLQVNTLGLAQAREVVMPKPADVFRVLVLGDSFIQGLGEGLTLPALAEQALSGWRSADGRRIEFVNGGTQSYSALLHTARWQHQLADTAADLVLVFPDLTDVYDDNERYRDLAEYAGGRLRRVPPSPAMRVHAATRQALAYDAVPLRSWKYLVAKLADWRALNLATDDNERRIFAHALDDEGAPRPATRMAVAFAIERLEALVEQVTRDGVRVALMSYPHEAQLQPLTRLGEPGAPAQLNRLFERAVAALASGLGLPYASYFEPLGLAVSDGESLYFAGDMHFNERGLRHLAGLVSNTLRTRGSEFLGSPLVAAPPSH